MKKSFISYTDEDGFKRDGYFEGLKIKDNYIQFKSGVNKITLPWVKVNKIKEQIK